MGHGIYITQYQRKHANMTSGYKLSIIIPAHNAAGYLARALPALKACWRDDFELIVVDDGSSDNTAAVAAAAGAKVVRLQQQGGPSGARNAGIVESSGDVLVFLDADVVARPDTILKLQETLDQHPEIAAVFGSYDDEPADRHLVSVFKNLMHHYVHQQGSGEAGTFWTGCGAIRRKVFDETGSFREVSRVCVEDIDYGHRLRDAGYKILLRPDIQVKHLKRWTLGGLIYTDVMQRGVPWTVMMLRRGRMDGDLNMGRRHRWSAVVALGIGLALILTAGFLLLNWAEAVSPETSRTAVLAVLGGVCAFLAALVFLQWDFYRFLAGRRGAWFAVRCLPLHVLYYWYSVVSVVLGLAVYFWKKSEV